MSIYKYIHIICVRTLYVCVYIYIYILHVYKYTSYDGNMVTSLANGGSSSFYPNIDV